MGVPWKKIFGTMLGIFKGIGPVLYPPLAVIIPNVEAALKGQPGEAKHEAARRIGRAALEAAGAMELLRPGEVERLKELEDAAISATVAAINAEEKLEAFVAEVKKRGDQE